MDKITTEICINAIVNHYKNDGDDLTNPKNWKRISKKGLDIITRVFENKRTNQKIVVTSTVTEITDIQDYVNEDKIGFEIIELRDKPYQYDNIDKLIDKLDLNENFLAELDSQIVNAGDNIIILDWNLEIEYVVLIHSKTIALCKGFCGGLTSDHWIIFKGVNEEHFVMFDEPMHMKSVKELLEEHPDAEDEEEKVNVIKNAVKKYKIKNIFLHM
jgi:hypothetical protein